MPAPLKICLCHDRRISYEVGGASSDPDTGPAALMVFLPPGASPAAIWRPITAHFHDRFRTAAVNPSAYGETEPFAGPAPMTVFDEAEATAAVMQAELPQGAGARAHIVGHSYGGTIALEIARHWPGLVSRLTLLEPAPYPLLREAGEDELAAAIAQENQRFIAMVRGDEPGGAAAAMERYLDYFNNRPGFWRSLDAQARDKLLLLADRIAIGLAAVDRLEIDRAALAQIDCPVTVIHGGETDALNARLSAVVAEAIPQATLTSLPGAGHMMTLTHGAAVCALIDAALADE